MKKTLLITFMIFGFLSNAQEFKAEGKTLTGIFEANGKSKSELFSLINKWIAINYNSSKNVIQMNDLESGTIIVKGINEVTYKNPNYVIYKYEEFITLNIYHLIEINIKDNKFRIIYTVTDLENKKDCRGGLCFIVRSLNVSHINLTLIEDSVVEKYNFNLINNFKGSWEPKEKKEKVILMTKPLLEEVNNQILNQAKEKMLLISSSIINKQDGW